MKKLILSFITLIGFFSLSIGIEGNIKVGYEFFGYATYTEERTGYTIDTDKHTGRGYEKSYRYITYEETYSDDKNLVLGAELLPLTFKDARIKLGVGVEYLFGVNYYFNGSPGKLGPLYATSKFTYYRQKNIDFNLYTFARLGYVFNPKERVYRSNHYSVGGLYYGLGLGLDYKYFLAEILYEGKYNKTPPSDSLNHVYGNVVKNFFGHKVGMRFGVQLGSQHFKKSQISNCPKCETKIVEKLVEVPKVVKKNTTNKIIIKNFDISAQALFGFNKSNLSDLKEGGKKEIEEKVKELQKSGFEITGIKVIGHTDRLGTDEYNYKLGLNRAETIKEYLKELGIKVEIKSSSKGNTEPKVHCNNVKSKSKLKECLQPNRRVELQFLGFETEKKVEEVVETVN